VKTGGKTKTFPITEKTAFVQRQKEDGKSEARRAHPAILAEKPAKAKKKGIPVELKDFDIDGKTQLRAVYFDLHNKPKTKKVISSAGLLSASGAAQRQPRLALSRGNRRSG
jgi:hypothetical protein